MDSYQYKLVYTLSLHPQLGSLIEAYSVKLNEDKTFSLSFAKINPQNINTTNYFVTEIDRKLIGLIEEYNEEAIAKKFQKKGKKFCEMIKGWDEKLFEDQIRPFIEIRIIEILKTIVQNEISIYYKGLRKGHIPDDEINIPKDPVKVVFNFESTDEDLKYNLTLQHKDKNISLFERIPIFLYAKPIWLYLDNCLYHFTEDINYKKLVPFTTRKYIVISKDAEKQYFKTFILNAVKLFEVNAIGFDIEKVEKKPVPVLKFQIDIQTNHVFQLWFNYDKKSIYQGDNSLNFVELSTNEPRYNFKKISRDFQFEEKIKNELLSLGLIQTATNDFVPPDSELNVYNLVNWLNKNELALNNSGFQVIQIEANTSTFFFRKD